VLDIYRGQGVADQLMPYDSKGEHAGWNGKRKLGDALRDEKFDVALLLQNAFDAAWITWRAGIPERIGYARDGRGILLTRAIRTPRPGEVPAHEKFYYLELLRRAGWIDNLPDDELISLRVPDPAKAEAEGFLGREGVRPDAIRIAVGAGASYGSAKCWPAERFASALNSLTAQEDVEVILFGTAGEATVNGAIAEKLRKPVIDLTGKTPVAQLPALLSRCQLFIGNDSGAMHVAAAVGLPVVAVFGPTDPEGTAAVTPKCAIVQQKSYCSPCFLRRCPTDHRCMTGVTPVMVEKAARVLLRGTNPA
jgi:lipopolysaccharide heptosyltransferase II